MHSYFLATLCCFATGLIVHGQFEPPTFFFPEQQIQRRLNQIVDINADGLADAVYGSSYGPSFALGGSGGGFGAVQHLHPVQPFELSSYTSDQSCRAADMDGDGDLDIVESFIDTTGVPQYVIWRNNGDATSFAAETLSVPLSFVADLLCVDFDNDGDEDILFLGSTASILRNDGGDSWFHLDLDGLGALFSDQVVDITGDGTPEWLFQTNVSGQPSIIIRNWTAGAFVETDTVGLGSVWPDNGVATGDMDGDGDVDLVTRTGFQSPSTIINFGDGTWSLPWQLDLDGYEGWAPPFRGMHLGDLDLDGDLDILSMGEPTSCWYANAGGGLQFIRNEVLSPEQFSISMSSNLTPRSRLFDNDMDGDLDVITDRGSGLQVWLNDGTGTFSTLEDYSASFGPSNFLHAFGDMDNDGYDDVLLHMHAQNITLWARNLGDGNFAEPEMLTLGPGLNFQPILVDVDGDGSRDVIWHDGNAVYWSRNDLPVGFGPVLPIHTPDVPARFIAFRDVDGDGDGDPVTEQGLGSLFYQANDGSGNFGPDVLLAGTFDFYQHLEIVDIVGDELPDILYYGAASTTSVMENLGGATFAPATQLNYLYGKVTIVDLDNDGDNDILLPTCPNCEGDQNGIAWQENLGQGSWSETHPIHRFEQFWAEELICADVDGDSDKDILFRQNGITFSTHFIENLGGEVFATPTVAVAEEDFITGLASITEPNAPFDLVGGYGYPFWMRNAYEGPYQVRGRVYFDENADGNFDAGEPPFPFASIVTDSPVLFTLTSANGGYEIGMLPATVQLNASVGSNELWVLNEGAAGYTVTTTEASPIASGLDFGFVPTGENSLFEVEIVRGIGPCGGQIPVWLHVKNTGTVSESGFIDLSVDEEMSILGNIPDGAVVSGNTLSLPFDGLGFMRTMVLPLTLGLPSAAFSGDVLSIAVTVSPAGAPASQVVNDTLSWVLTCSYDPNDKQVEPLGYGTFGSVRDTLNELEYTIRFQNVGTGPAFHVRIVDQLPAGLEWSGFAIKASSHVPSTVVINESGELEVGFLYIMLPDSSSDPTGSQGFIKFTIPLGADLPHLTAISNTASIFFDFNEPVITNTTITTLVDCDLWEPVVDNLLPDLLQATEGDLYQWFFNGEAITDATTRWLDVAQLGSYSAQVTSPYGCTAMSGEVQVISLGIAQHDRALLHAVPNPFNNSTIIRSSIPITPDHTITLCDAQGRVVLSDAGKGGDTFQIERGRLSQGLYLVRLHSANNGIESTLRVVIE